MNEMDEIKHPSEILDKSQVEIIRQSAYVAEKSGQLVSAQLDIIYQNNWFNLFVPHEYGGLDLSLLQALIIEEALAWADGSLGWTVTLCSGANWFIGYLPESTRELLFSDPLVCLAGSGKPTGVAVWNGKEYRVTGEWNYATGAPHATAFTANCYIEENGERCKNANGSDMIRSFVFHKSEVELISNWNVMGMIATASLGFKVSNLSIPYERSFIIEPECAQLNGTVFRFPFLQFAEATLVVNVSGMTMRFIELCEDILAEDSKDALSEIQKQLAQMREVFFSSVEALWNDFDLHGMAEELQLIHFSKTCKDLLHTCLISINKLYPYCGLPAANPAKEINRIWRNFFTVIHHPILRAPK